MTQSVSREVRLLILAALLVGLYGIIAAAVTASHDQLDLLLSGELNAPMVAIWGIAFAFAFCSYAIDLTVRRRPVSPLRTMFAEISAEVLRVDWLLARSTLVAAWFCLMVFFTPLKIVIGHVRGFPYDQTLVELDRTIFFGHDPWTLTHALFGSVPATFLLHVAYTTWFMLMWLSIIYFMLRPELVRLRARYIVAFLLCWMMVGSLAAYFLASAGPCFYERAFGDPHFRPLMDRLHAIDADLKAVWPGFGVHALGLQDMLWGAFTAKRDLFGGGISAMPSMHVSIAVLMACGGWHLNKRMGRLLTGFAVVIWIGSVHFGWHYALDGVVAAGMTLAIWWFSGWLVDRWVLAEAPAASPQPALAE